MWRCSCIMRLPRHVRWMASLRLRSSSVSVNSETLTRANPVRNSESVAPRQMPLPSSSLALYRNLLSVSSIHPFSLTRAIDYYFDSPRALHSTRSFNFLIALALRSASFSHVRLLFRAMRVESVPENMETWKLHVRWFVRIGKWNDAWKRVLEISAQRNASANLPNNTIPLPLWLELFGSQKRGAIRHWVVTNHMSDGNTSSADPVLRKRLVPRPCQRSRTIELLQYQALMQVSPLLTSSDNVPITPRTILIVTQTMHRVGQSTLASSTALSYLKSLPPQLRRCDRRRVLDLVHLHLSMVAPRRKSGLKRHFTQRRVLWQFLHARPDVKPSSTTLFLLLGSLRGCCRSGTLAMHCLQLFRKRWGPRVQSRSVLRRVASLALKEGRLDIVDSMLKLERRCRVLHDALPRSSVSTSTRRKPWRTLFSRQGAENRRWRLIEDKFRRRLVSRAPS